MKVLILNGSPNVSGTTASALQIVENVLNNNGIETETMQIGSKRISGCISCRKCAKTSRCVFDDEVNTALDKMKDCDGLLVGSPVYYASPNGTLIAFLDRMFFAGDKRLFAHKVGAAVAAARRAGSVAAIDVLNKYFTIVNMPVASSQYWNMVFGMNAKEAEQDLEGRQDMCVLGENMSWLLKCIEAGKRQGLTPPDAPERVRTNFIR